MRRNVIFFGLLAAVAAVLSSAAGENSSIYTKNRSVAITSEVDRALEVDWQKKGLLPVQEATDNLLVRRLYLDLTGRLPSIEAAKSFVYSRDPQKYEKLVDALLASRDFVTYFTMRFCDILRVKSEFPINLWPNAVYIYQRRIEAFLEKDEPYNKFIRALLLAKGSNFRVAEANFYRAHADRSPLGIAKNVMLTLCGVRLEKMPEEQQKLYANIFEEIGFKSTKEWKEEIVYIKSCPARKIMLPSGAVVDVAPGKEARKIFADHMTGTADGKRLLASALVNRTWFWFFGSGIASPADDLLNAKCVNDRLLELLVKQTVDNRMSFRKLCRSIVLSAAYRSGSFQGKDTAAKVKAFAAYPVRRLEAEVLDDAITALTLESSHYSSVIPEPFTFLPHDMRTVSIADGSISSSFLILFGRPSRDAGVLAERNDNINAKQRLFLFNSGALYRKVCRIMRRKEFARLHFMARVEAFYWMFFSRPPMAKELDIIKKRYDERPKKMRWTMQNDLAWIMVNSAEFLHRH